MKKVLIGLCAILIIYLIAILFVSIIVRDQAQVETAQNDELVIQICGNSISDYALAVEVPNYKDHDLIEVFVSDNFDQYEGLAHHVVEKWFRGMNKTVVLTNDASTAEFTFEFDKMFFSGQGRSIEQGVVGIALMYSSSQRDFQTRIKINPYFDFLDESSALYASIRKVLFHEVGHGVGVNHHPNDCKTNEDNCGVMANDLNCIQHDDLQCCDYQLRDDIYSPPVAFCALKF